VEPLEYLAPFLQVIKTPETSGTVTDVALSAALKFLGSRLLGEQLRGRCCRWSPEGAMQRRPVPAPLCTARWA
jgi:hypothetical protein